MAKFECSDLNNDGEMKAAIFLDAAKKFQDLLQRLRPVVPTGMSEIYWNAAAGDYDVAFMRTFQALCHDPANLRTHNPAVDKMASSGNEAVQPSNGLAKSPARPRKSAKAHGASSASGVRAKRSRLQS